MFWEAVELLDVVKKESGRSFRYDHYVCRNEMYSLGDGICKGTTLGLCLVT